MKLGGDISGRGKNIFHYNLELKKQRLIQELRQLKSAGNFVNEQDSSLRQKIEIADAVAEFERRTALDIQKQTSVAKMEKALRKIDEGTYGICDDCGKGIEPARMEILPYASLCINCCKEGKDINVGRQMAGGVLNQGG
jgi:RNA polymerase-binding transcription factor DksA